MNRDLPSGAMLNVETPATSCTKHDQSMSCGGGRLRKAQFRPYGCFYGNSSLINRGNLGSSALLHNTGAGCDS